MPEGPTTVGRYEILRELGRGGMAVVHLARQKDLHRLVALKELDAFRAGDPNFVRRFIRESRVAGSLTHTNVVTVHEFFEREGVPYIAMEYVERGSLRPYLGQLSLAQIAGVLEGTLAGLAYAANRNLVHRDIKPENIMVSYEGRVKITDFGIAKARDELADSSFMTRTGTTVGTPAYMAPEQALAAEVGPRTDLYSLGTMAYEMLCGQRPFPDSGSAGAALVRLVRDPVPPPRDVNPDLTPGVYAYAGRDVVVDKVLEILGATATYEVHNHHNFAWRERHFGVDAWVIRKGCTPAFPGQEGFVGATMGEPSVILRGTDHPDGAGLLHSTVHGAGRAMSRTQAAGRMGNRAECTERDCTTWVTWAQYRHERERAGVADRERFSLCADHPDATMQKRRGRIKTGAIDFDAVQHELSAAGVELRGGAADEAPNAYKRLDTVLAAHANTIEIVHRLTPIGVAMAGTDTYDPYKD
jgi:hypothetical protein